RSNTTVHYRSRTIYRLLVLAVSSRVILTVWVTLGEGNVQLIADRWCPADKGLGYADRRLVPPFGRPLTADLRRRLVVSRGRVVACLSDALSLAWERPVRARLSMVVVAVPL